jgi:PIN domain-containing protein
MRFFFDRNMSRYLAQAIDKLDRENDIRHHDDDPRFEPETADIEWMTTLARDDPPWIVLSGDGSILKNRAERAALEESGLTFFCMAKQWKHMNLYEYSWRLIKTWPSILESAKRASLRPQIFEVTGGRTNKVDLIR